MQNHNDAIKKAMDLAKTKEGQQLIAMLHQAGGTELENAMAAAASGDLTQVQKAITQLMNHPDARKLLEKMEF